MKTLTIPGKYYIIRSSIGCTVTQEGANGQTLANDVPADEDTPVFAHSGKFQISDDNATVTEVFKLAPIAFGGGGKPGWYDVLRSELAELLGAGNFSLTYAWRDDKFTLTLAVPLEITDEQMAQVNVLLGSIPPRNLETEIDEMPMGFSRLSWIQNPGTAYIDTGLKMSSEYEIEAVVDYLQYNTGQNSLLITSTFESVNRYNIILVNWNMLRMDYAKSIVNEYIGSQSALGKRWIVSTSKNKITLQVPELSLSKTWTTNEATFTTNDNALLFSLRGSWPFTSRFLTMRGSESGVPRFDFIPAFDEASGTPCLFDKIRRKMFYSSGTSAFIAGVETQKQLDAVLRGLPDRTGQEAWELHLGLSDALYEAAVESGIIETTATAKNWQIAYDPTTITETA